MHSYFALQPFVWCLWNDFLLVCQNTTQNKTLKAQKKKWQQTLAWVTIVAHLACPNITVYLQSNLSWQINFLKAAFGSFEINLSLCLRACCVKRWDKLLLNLRTSDGCARAYCGNDVAVLVSDNAKEKKRKKSCAISITPSALCVFVLGSAIRIQAVWLHHRLGGKPSGEVFLLLCLPRGSRAHRGRREVATFSWASITSCGSTPCWDQRFFWTQC